MEMYIAKEEYVAGAFGIETRYPFLDVQVVQEFLWLLPELKNGRFYYSSEENPKNINSIKTETIINNAATVTTDTTLDDWGDGETHILKVLVSKAGAVTYEYDGATPTVTVAYSFDAGEVVTPTLYVLQTGDFNDSCILRKLTIESDNGSMEA